MGEFAGGTHEIIEGDWAGWRKWGSDPFEDHNGPFYFRKDADGRVRCAFRAEDRHMNGAGFMHGGCMMTFADYALFCIATDELAGGAGVTLTMNSEFVSSGQRGELIEATGEIVKAGASVIFIRGELTASSRVLMTFSGVIKRVKRKP